LNCKTWNCSYCGPRKAKRYKHAIRRAAEDLQLCRFLTLTLDPAKIVGEPVPYLNATFAKLRVYWKRRYGVAPKYIRILEFQQNKNPHFHILIDRYMPREWIQESWVAVGGGRMVDIRYVDIHRISRYLSKYLTKELLLSELPPFRSRRVSTSRGIKLLDNGLKSDIDWEFKKHAIEIFSRLFQRYVITMSVDEEGCLEAFSILQTEI
jgi:hypothetical protein